MDSQHDRLRHLRLARALAGSEVEGLKAIEEIRSVSKLAHFHTRMSNNRTVDTQAIAGAFQLIEQHAKRAAERYSEVLDALYEFIESYDAT